MLLHELTHDVLEDVLRRLSPSEVGRLVITCTALKGSAMLLVDWVWLRGRLSANAVSWNDAFRMAAWEGRLQALIWGRRAGCTSDDMVCAAAARGGYLEVLQWLRTQAPPYHWDSSTCSEAASHGHLRLLQWARAQAPPCLWTRIPAPTLPSADTSSCCNGRGPVHLLAPWTSGRVLVLRRADISESSLGHARRNLPVRGVKSHAFQLC